MTARASKSANVQLSHAEVPRRRAPRGICVVAENIDSGANVGSLFRVCDALGVERLYLIGSSPVPPSPKIRKTSRMTERVVPYEHAEDALPLIERLRADGYAIVSLELTTRSLDLRSFDAARAPKLALVLGSESFGVSQALLDASDHTLHIPMCGQNSSMNVASACAIAVFELTRALA